MDIRLSGFVLWIHLCFCGVVSSVRIEQGPQNQTVTAGDTASFSCIIVGRSDTDYVFWKKISTAEEFAQILTYNLQSLNTSKYTVDSDQTLSIHHVAIVDEGLYECQSGPDRPRALLTVAVPMTNVTLTSDHPRSPHSKVTFTCHVIHSRPPAEIRWFLGSDEITSMSATPQQMKDEVGFGDTTSKVTLVDDGRSPVRCSASLPGTTLSKSEVLNGPIETRTSTGTWIARQDLAVYMLTCLIFILLLSVV